jgi:hypothetical protein
LLLGIAETAHLQSSESMHGNMRAIERWH